MRPKTAFNIIWVGILLAGAAACGGRREPAPTATAPPPTATVAPTAAPVSPTPPGEPSATPRSMPPQMNYLPPDLPVIEAANADQLQPLITLYSESSDVYAASLAFSPDGNSLATGASDGWVEAWDLMKLEAIIASQQPGDISPEVVFAADGSGLAATGMAQDDAGEFAGAVYLWAVPPNPDDPRSLITARMQAYGVVFFDDGVRLAVGTQEGMGGGGAVKIWQVSGGDVLQYQIDTPDRITDLALSPADGLLAGTSFDTVAFWEPATQETIQTFPVDDGPLWQVAFSPDGNSLAVRGNRITLLNAQNGEALWALDAVAKDMAFSSSGELLATVDDRGLQIWDAASRDLMAEYASEASLLAVAFSPRGNALATASSEGVVRLWGVRP